jgi:pimeloyl-ACP methyl ester carboxylesterase
MDSRPAPAGGPGYPGIIASMPTAEFQKTHVTVSGMKIELRRRGRGSPLLLLPGEEALEAEAAFVDELVREHELLIPAPPGFGTSDRPDWISNVDDIAYVYLDLVEKLGVGKVPVLGFSLGGWIAAEIATKDDSFISKLALVAPYGIKVGGPTDRDIADIWSLHPAEVLSRKWHDAEKGKRDFPSMPEEELTIIARNVESLARFCWEPYLHNPRLKHRLHRIKVPTRLIWGAQDGIVTPAYGKAYADLIPGATLSVLPKAGHYPHLEQPKLFVAQLREFLRS